MGYLISAGKGRASARRRRDAEATRAQGTLPLARSLFELQQACLIHSLQDRPLGRDARGQFSPMPFLGEGSFVFGRIPARLESVVVDQHPPEAVLFEPPVGEVLGQPTRGSLRGEIPVRGRVEDGDAELGFDGVEDSADGLGVYAIGSSTRSKPLTV